MSTLSTSILELGFTSERDMEEALARQVMYGGDLATNVLELGLVTEEQLLEASARSSGLGSAPPGELPRGTDALAAALSASEQRRHGVYLFGEEEGAVLVAVSEKLPLHVEEALAATLGKPIHQLITTWARLEQAWARSGASNLSERALHLLKRLEGRPSVGPLSPGLPVDFKQLPRPQSVPPVEFTFAAHDFDVSTAPPPEGYIELALAQAQEARRNTPEYVRAPLGPTTTSIRRRGPYTAAMAERDLLEAKDRHDVLTAFFDFSAQYFEYAVLFVLKGGQAVGYRARGSGAHSERVRDVQIPLDLPSAFSRARDEAGWVLTRLRAGGIEGGLARDLARGTGRKVLILPLLVKGRPVVFLYGDHGSADVDLTSVGDILSFAPLASAALERVILRSKGYGRMPPLAPPQLAPLRPRPGVPLPTRGQQAQNLAQLVTTAPTPPPLVPPSIAPLSNGPPPAAPSPTPDEASQEGSRAPHQPLMSEARAWTRRYSSAPPFPSKPPRTLPGVAAPANPPPELPPAADVGAIPARRTVSLGPEPPDASATTSAFEAPPPPAPSWMEPPEDGWDIDATFEDNEHGTVAGVGPHSAGGQPALSSRPTARFSQPPAGPLELLALVERLCGGDDSVVDALVQAGDQAIAALVGRFPGPLPQAKRASGGKASECGPVLAALVRFGARAIPYLTVRTADEDAQVREWATRLLGELPSREAAQAVARRTVDDSMEVRRAALAAARMVQHVPEAREGTRMQLEELACDAALPAQVRRSAIEALTDLREGSAIPCMIQLLGDTDREVSGAARWSLVVLARQDFGADQDYWSRFWTANRERHRIEWLIDSLTHESRDIRRAAGDELKSLSKEYFGYYDDLPEAERERVQNTYREWWTREGRARFEAGALRSLRPDASP
jgi:hypothetical protein